MEPAWKWIYFQTCAVTSVGPGIRAYFCVCFHLPREYGDWYRSKNQTLEGCVKIPFIWSDKNPIKQKEDIYWTTTGKAGACWALEIIRTGTSKLSTPLSLLLSSFNPQAEDYFLAASAEVPGKASDWLYLGHMPTHVASEAQGLVTPWNHWLRWGRSSSPKEGVLFPEERKVLDKQPSAPPGARELVIETVSEKGVIADPKSLAHS